MLLLLPLLLLRLLPLLQRACQRQRRGPWAGRWRQLRRGRGQRHCLRWAWQSRCAGGAACAPERCRRRRPAGPLLLALALLLLLLLSLLVLVLALVLVLLVLLLLLLLLLACPSQCPAQCPARCPPAWGGWRRRPRWAWRRQRARERLRQCGAAVGGCARQRRRAWLRRPAWPGPRRRRPLPRLPRARPPPPPRRAWAAQRAPPSPPLPARRHWGATAARGRLPRGRASWCPRAARTRRAAAWARSSAAAGGRAPGWAQARPRQARALQRQRRQRAARGWQRPASPARVCRPSALGGGRYGSASVFC
jgi:hypothetical protein